MTRKQCREQQSECMFDSLRIRQRRSNVTGARQPLATPARYAEIVDDGFNFPRHV